MSGTPLLLALWTLVLLATLGALVWLTTWAVFGDRDWRRPRCPRCWHDMSRATSMRCSECGFEVPTERALHRRRRRWSVALLAFVATFSLAFYMRTSWLASGWTSMLPTRVAIWLLPWSSSHRAFWDLREELGDRVLHGMISTGDAKQLLERVLAGDDDARPGTTPWQDKYGRLLDRWIASRPSRRHAPSGGTASSSEFDELESRLARLPPVLTLEPPATWVVDEPVPFEIMVRRPLPTTVAQRLVVERTTLPASPPTPLPPVDVPIQLSTSHFLMTRVPLFLAPLAAGAHAGTVRVRVENRDDDGEWREVAVLDVPIDVAVRATIPVPPPRRAPSADSDTVEGGRSDASAEAEAASVGEVPLDFLPVTGDAFDDAVRAFAAPGLIRWADGERRFAMRFDASSTTMATLRGVALGVEAEILEDGVVRRRLRAWWTGRGGLRFEPPQEDPDALARANTTDGRWTMRVRGVRDLALRSALATHPAGRRGWWAGEVIIPLNIDDVPTTAPPRAWSVGPRPVEPVEPADTAIEPDDS